MTEQDGNGLLFSHHSPSVSPAGLVWWPHNFVLLEFCLYCCHLQTVVLINMVWLAHHYVYILHVSSIQSYDPEVVHIP